MSPHRYRAEPAATPHTDSVPRRRHAGQAISDTLKLPSGLGRPRQRRAPTHPTRRPRSDSPSPAAPRPGRGLPRHRDLPPPPPPPHRPGQVQVEVSGAQEPHQEGIGERLRPALAGLCLRPPPQLGHGAAHPRRVVGQVTEVPRARRTLRHPRGTAELSPAACPLPLRAASRRGPAGLPPPPAGLNP